MSKYGTKGVYRLPNDFTEDSDLMCVECLTKSKVKDWDAATLSKYSSRECRRNFRSLMNPLSHKKTGRTKVYVCPKCGEDVDAFRLIDWFRKQVR